MLFVGRFRGDLLPVVLEAADGDEAVKTIEANTGTRPATLTEIPQGLLFAEVRFPALVGEGDAAEESSCLDECGEEMPVALDPSDDFAEWLEAVDEIDLPAVLDLVPPPLEAGEAVPDGER